MSNNRSIAIKNYICKNFVNEDADLQFAKNTSALEHMPPIAIPENVGKLIYMLVKLHQPKRILEVGTLAGYSTLWLAKAAPEAKIITLERDQRHAQVARHNFQNAGLSDQIHLIEGDALKSLKHLAKMGEKPFDLIFLDADKEGYPAYLPHLLALSKPGTLLLTDNLIPREEEIDHPASNDPEAINIYKYNAMLAAHPRLETILSTTIVGSSGRVDALGISLVKRA